MILFAVVQLYAVKYHPTMILPSFWIANALMVLLKPLHIKNQVSRLPLILRRAILFTVTQLYPVNAPPTIIFPSFWIANALTVLLKPLHIKNQVSAVPSVCIRTILFAMIPLYEINVPPTIIFPSSCHMITLISLSNQFQTAKLQSFVPSPFKRVTLLTATPLYAVNIPPTKSFPPLCRVKE
ncbi:MAG: hypothetical protein WCJ39_08820 [bacterium]